jgi:DNA transformation protein
MAVSADYLAWILERLEPLQAITHRRMFGGVGIYRRGLFFALIADDTLYFKVDDSNRGDFEAEDMGPFKPFPDRDETMSYYEVPIEVLEDDDLLERWAGRAYGVAETARAKRPAKKSAARPRRQRP